VSRFIRSALFPILIVIVVAMFIEWVIQGKSSNDAPKAIYSAPGMSTQQVLTSDLQAGVVKSVLVDPQSNLAQVTQLGGVFYVTPIADTAALASKSRPEPPRSPSVRAPWPNRPRSPASPTTSSTARSRRSS